MNTPDLFGPGVFWPTLPGCPVLSTPPWDVYGLVPAASPVTSVLVPQVPRRVPQVRVPQVSRLHPVKVRAMTMIDAEPPTWAQAPPTPLDLARLGLARVKAAEEGAARTLALAVAAYALWWIASTPRTATLLWLLATAYGLSVAWTCHAGAAPWRWSRALALTSTAAVSVCGIGLLLSGRSVFASVLAIGAAQGFAYRPEGTKDLNWWGERALVQTWLAAGLIDVKFAPWFRRIGKPEIDGEQQSLTGVWVTGPRPGVPLGITVGSINTRARLEGVMGLKVGQLHLSHDDDDEACAITMTVTPPPRRHVVSAALPDRWDYNAPLHVGKDRLGRPVSRRTWDCHTAVVGATGSGKTWFGRYDVAHALLDPTVSVYIIDGKDDAKDWRAMHPLCAGVVTGASKRSAEQAMAMLERIEALSDERRDESDAPGVVVVVDEWYRLIGAARRYDKRQADKMAALFSELLATARSRRIKFLTFWQRGTDSYIDTDQRGNMVQRFVGVTGDKAEARYVLDETPDQLPKGAGQFLFRDDGQPAVLVQVPALDRDAFAEVCARATLLRSGVVEPSTNPLEARVHDLLGLGPLRAKDLLSVLTEELRPRNSKGEATPQALGYAVRKMRGIGKTTVGPKSDPAYELLGKPPAVPAELPGPGGFGDDLSVSRDSRVAP